MPVAARTHARKRRSKNASAAPLPHLRLDCSLCPATTTPAALALEHAPAPAMAPVPASGHAPVQARELAPALAPALGVPSWSQRAAARRWRGEAGSGGGGGGLARPPATASPPPPRAHEGASSATPPSPWPPRPRRARAGASLAPVQRQAVRRQAALVMIAFRLAKLPRRRGQGRRGGRTRCLCSRSPRHSLARHRCLALR